MLCLLLNQLALQVSSHPGGSGIGRLVGQAKVSAVPDSGIHPISELRSAARISQDGTILVGYDNRYPIYEVATGKLLYEELSRSGDLVKDQEFRIATMSQWAHMVAAQSFAALGRAEIKDALSAHRWLETAVKKDTLFVADVNVDERGPKPNPQYRLPLTGLSKDGPIEAKFTGDGGISIKVLGLSGGIKKFRLVPRDSNFTLVDELLPRSPLGYRVQELSAHCTIAVRKEKHVAVNALGSKDWLVYDEVGKRWCALPPIPKYMAPFALRGNVWAKSVNSETRLWSYSSSANRFENIGDFILLCTSSNERYMALQNAGDHKVWLADFGDYLPKSLEK